MYHRLIWNGSKRYCRLAQILHVRNLQSIRCTIPGKWMFIPLNSFVQCRNYSIVSQMEDHSTTLHKGSSTEINKQKAIKAFLQKDSDSGRYKEKIMKVLEESSFISDEELCVVFRHLFQRNYHRCIMDLTDVLYLLNRISVLQSSAELILKAASVEKNIRIATLMSTLLSPDPFSSSIYSTQTALLSTNPVLEAQQISTLFAVKKLKEGKELLEQWPHSHFSNPIILSSLLTGLVDGKYYREAIELYDWCCSNADSSKLRTTVTVASLINSFQHTQQIGRAIQLYDEAIAEDVVLTKKVFIDVAHMLDSSSMWRQEYKELIKLPEYKDRSKRQLLQVKLYLQQLYKAVSVLIECDKEYPILLPFFNHDTESFYIDCTKTSSSLLRLHLMYLFFSYSHKFNHITKGSMYLKMDRSEEKQQAFEKLLSSDLYPPIQYEKEEQTTFFGGGNGRVSSISYSISIPSVRSWSIKNHVLKEFPIL